MRDIDSLPISDGVKHLARGYIDYAEEVITERAIPSVFDGLKPVNRRILYTMYTQCKPGQFTKSQRVCGNVLALHPHGDSAVYKAAVPMADSRGTYAFPLIKARGNFGDVMTGRCAAAPRYTEMQLHPNANAVFGEMDGISMIPNFDATLTEPQYLPVSFPNILVNASEGIAVGFSSKIPAFNFNDVITLCEEYVRDGECKSVIVPDFTTGGYYVKNNKELKKLMLGGKASLKLRGKVIVEGKNITITEVPYGKPISYLKKQIDDKDINGIVECGNISDYTHGAGLLIKCRSKNVVNQVLYSLYKDTDLQSFFHANMVVVVDGSPKLMGVYDIIKTWVEWRKTVVMKHLQVEKERLETSIRESKAFKELIDMTEIKNEFVSRVSTEGRAKAVEWLKQQEGVKERIPEDLLRYVSTRSLDSYHTGGSIVTKYLTEQKKLDAINESIEDINSFLLRQFEALKAEYGSSIQRRTEVTNVDYEFASKEEEVKADETPCYYAFKDNFLKKLRYEDMAGDYEYQFAGKANDTLIAIDNLGQILRVYCADLPYGGASDLGHYLPRYLGIENPSQDYSILWIAPLDGSKKTLIYNDGTVGFLDTSEWVGLNRQVRVLKNGISEYAYRLGAILDELPEVLMVVDSDGRLGYVETKNIKEKNRTARTRVWDMKGDAYLESYCGCTLMDAILALPRMQNFTAPKMKFLESEEDFNGENLTFYSL